jgi:hypothetical protein
MCKNIIAATKSIGKGENADGIATVRNGCQNRAKVKRREFCQATTICMPTPDL